MKWVTRERPKIDRLACPWLIRRFIDKDAEFRYVPASEVRETALAEGSIPYDIPDAGAAAALGQGGPPRGKIQFP